VLVSGRSVFRQQGCMQASGDTKTSLQGQRLLRLLRQSLLIPPRGPALLSPHHRLLADFCANGLGALLRVIVLSFLVAQCRRLEAAWKRRKRKGRRQRRRRSDLWRGASALNGRTDKGKTALHPARRGRENFWIGGGRLFT